MFANLFEQRTFKETMMKQLTLLACLSCALALTACNTVRGLGQDIEKAGEKIQDATKK